MFSIFSMTTVELVAVIFTLFSVIYAANKSILNWAYGVIGIVMYAIIFFERSLYYNFLLQFVYLIQSIYGIVEWRKNKSNNQNTLKISYLNIKNRSIFVDISIILLILYFLNITQYTSLLDIITSFISIIATYMLAKGKIENWILWMVVDVIYIILFFTVGLYISAFLYLIYFILCIWGYIKWSKIIKNEKV